MATMQKWVPASPDDLWAVVADPRSYAFWVVGSHDIRSAEGDWPAPGSKFHHTQGHGPVKLKDSTVVRESQPPHRLVLEVRLRPFGIGRVELRFDPDRNADGEEGTCVTMVETMESGPLGLVPEPLLAPGLKLRNADTLRRLAAMAWTRAQVAADGSGSASGPAGAGTTPRSSAKRTKARA